MNAASNLHPARRLWQHFEPVHAVTYFAPEVQEALAATGLTGFWRGYFAARAAPLGPVGPEVVQATFYGFAPALVRKCLPLAWEQCPPAEAVAARDAGVVAAYERLGIDPDEATVALAERAAAAGRPEGRALYAAHAAWVAANPPAPADRRLRLWWATTLLREHRGDGHNAALAAAGVDGCEANHLALLDGVAPPERQQVIRGWDDADWEAGAARAAARPAGFRAALEATTDELADGPIAALGPQDVDELCRRLRPLVDAVVGDGTFAYPNPIGVTALRSVPEAEAEEHGSHSGVGAGSAGAEYR